MTTSVTATIISNCNGLTLASSKGVVLQQFSSANFIEYTDFPDDSKEKFAWTLVKLLPYLPSGVVMLCRDILNTDDEVLVVDLETHLLIGLNDGTLPLALGLYSGQQNLKVFKLGDFEEMKIEGTANVLRDKMAPLTGLYLSANEYKSYLEEFPPSKVVPFTSLEYSELTFSLDTIGEGMSYSLPIGYDDLVKNGYSFEDKILVDLDGEQNLVKLQPNFSSLESPNFFIDDLGAVAFYSSNTNLTNKKITIIPKETK
jgi:hypothetical protein